MTECEKAACSVAMGEAHPVSAGSLALEVCTGGEGPGLRSSTGEGTLKWNSHLTAITLGGHATLWLCVACLHF